MENNQFTKPWYTIYHFTQKGIDVQCPECGGHAVSTGKSKHLLPWIPTDTRLICRHCGYTKTASRFNWSGPVHAYGRRPCGHCGYKWVEARLHKASPPQFVCNSTDSVCPECKAINRVPVHWGIDFLSAAPIDPFHGEPLWYVDAIKGQTLWAYNLEHLLYLKEYLSSSLRTRDKDAGKYSTLANLPTWMKARKNRDAVIKSLDRLIKK